MEVPSGRPVVTEHPHVIRALVLIAIVEDAEMAVELRYVTGVHLDWWWRQDTKLFVIDREGYDDPLAVELPVRLGSPVEVTPRKDTLVRATIRCKAQRHCMVDSTSRWLPLPRGV